MDPSLVIYEVTDVDCPDVKFALRNNTHSGTGVDEIFNMEGNTKFTIYSTDMNKLGVYGLRLNIRYTGTAYDFKDNLVFTVTVVDPCLNIDVNLPANIFSQNIIEYYVGSPTHTETINESDINKGTSTINCPSVVLFMTTSEENEIDSSIFTFVNETRTFMI